MKMTMFLLLILSFVFGSASISYPQYPIIQITNNSYQDVCPQVNGSGHVVWLQNYWVSEDEDPYADSEIFLNNGTSTIQLTNNSYSEFCPLISNSGQAAWKSYGNIEEHIFPQIFLYNGTSTIQLTNDSCGHYWLQVNNNGAAVWAGGCCCSYFAIFIYNGSSVQRLTGTSIYDFHFAPQINDNGHVVWYGIDFNLGGTIIYLYNGVYISELAHSCSTAYPKISNNGHVVWVGSNVNPNALLLYDGEKVIQLTDSYYTYAYDQGFQINNAGHVVWIENDGNDTEIFLYDGEQVTQLTDNSVNDLKPEINDKGYVVWLGVNDFGSYNLFLYDGERVVQLSEQELMLYQINENYIVWSEWDGEDYEVFKVDLRPRLFVMIPGVGGLFLPKPEHGETMLERARYMLRDDDSCILQIRESKKKKNCALSANIQCLNNPTPLEVSMAVLEVSKRAQEMKKDVIVDIDMDLEGYTVFSYINSLIFNGKWDKSVVWAGKMANIVSDAFSAAFKQEEKAGIQRILYAHSAGVDAVYRSINQCVKQIGCEKKYDDINLFNGAAKAKKLKDALISNGYNSYQVKAFTCDHGDFLTGLPGAFLAKPRLARAEAGEAWVHLNSIDTCDHMSLINTMDEEVKFNVKWNQDYPDVDYCGTVEEMMLLDYTKQLEPSTCELFP